MKGDLHKQMKKWRRIEIFQTIFSTLIISSILVFSLYNACPSIFGNSPKAVRLVLGGQSSNKINIGQPEILRVYAVDICGKIDKSRNDTVEIVIDPPYVGKIFNSTKLRLQNGETTFTVIIYRNEIFTLTAKWIEGKTKLESVTVAFNPYFPRP
jgi:hypothetical protein